VENRQTVRECVAALLHHWPDSWRAQFQAARGFLALGEARRAHELSAHLAERYPGNVSIVTNYASTCRAAGEPELGVRAPDPFVEAGQVPLTTLKAYLTALCAAGLFDEAGERAGEAVSRMTPSDAARIHGHLARVVFGHGRYRQARRRLVHAARLDPGDAVLRHDLGQTFLRLSDPEQARAAFEAALEIDPAYLKARRELAFVLEDLGRHGEAREHGEEVRKRHPDDPEAQERLRRER